MCAVSVMYDYYRQQPVDWWTPSTFNQFQEIIQRLDKLDKDLGDKECHDPAKAEWVKDVEERLARLEERLR